VLGVAYALVSAYWGLGGHHLLDTVGGGLEREGRAHNALLLVVVWVSVVLKLVAAGVGLLASSRAAEPAPAWHRPARAIAWTAAVILAVYGGLLTIVGLLVQAGIIAESSSADERALRWHAYLWDPWFLIWGVLMLAALRWSRPRAS
jgi:Protein of unknown function (DUF3995)